MHSSTASEATLERSTAPAAVLQYVTGECSLGCVLVAASQKGVCAVTLGDDPTILLNDLARRFPGAQLAKGDAACGKLMAAVQKLIENPGRAFSLPLDLRTGTAFQHSVWAALQDIPAGTTASYADIAARIGQPKAVRAVAQACGANHLAVIIPCHRVVRSDGSLSGYRWGVARKNVLLEREGASVEHP